MLAIAIISISCALIFYTVGVFCGKISGTLKKWHIAIFWAGFVFDTTGTTLMSKIANNVWSVNFHSITGLIAIVLMAINAAWATITLVRGDEKSKCNFHKCSILVWIIWLFPYFSGMIYGMVK